MSDATPEVNPNNVERPKTGACNPTVRH